MWKAKKRKEKKSYPPFVAICGNFLKKSCSSASFAEMRFSGSSIKKESSKSIVSFV